MSHVWARMRSDIMAKHQTLYIQYFTHDRKNHCGCPVDIPLSVQPSCGKNHFDKVDFIFIEIMYWFRNDAVDEFMKQNSNGDVVNEDGYFFAEIKRSTIMDLRDDLLRYSKGKKMKLIGDPTFYWDFDKDKKDRKRAIKDVGILDQYLHEDETTRFFYTSS